MTKSKRQELEQMAEEQSLTVLYHNGRYRISPQEITDFHAHRGLFTGTVKECLIWMAGYAEGVDRTVRVIASV